MVISSLFLARQVARRCRHSSISLSLLSNTDTPDRTASYSASVLDLAVMGSRRYMAFPLGLRVVQFSIGYSGHFVTRAVTLYG